MKTKSIVTIIIVILALIIISDGLYILDETEQAIITRFGKPIGEPKKNAGLKFKTPFIEMVHKFEKRMLEWDGDPNQIPTKDKKYIWVDTYARWKINDPLKFYQSVRNEREALGRLDDIIDAATRDFVTAHELIEIVRNSNREMAMAEEEMELADCQREWVKKCKDLLPFADEDGVVCIPAVRGEQTAADRLLNLLAAAYGNEWSNDKLSELLKQVDHAGKTLDSWLREKFFTQHCKLFHQRPFIWHIWDGLQDGFAALANYHKLDRKNLETLIYTYLGDWIKRQKDDIASGVDGAQEKLAAAENLKKQLE